MQDLSLGPCWLGQTGQLTRKPRNLHFSGSLALELQVRATTPGCSYGCWGSNLEPHAIMTSTSPMELSPQLSFPRDQQILYFYVTLSEMYAGLQNKLCRFKQNFWISSSSLQVEAGHICLLCRLFLKKRTLPLRTVFHCQPPSKVSVVTMLISPVLKGNEHFSVHCEPRYLLSRSSFLLEYTDLQGLSCIESLRSAWVK